MTSSLIVLGYSQEIFPILENLYLFGKNYYFRKKIVKFGMIKIVPDNYDLPAGHLDIKTVCFLNVKKKHNCLAFQERYTFIITK